MARFAGVIGFAVTREERPGIFVPDIEERSYRGDILKETAEWIAANNKANADLRINNRVSIVADAYARQHFHDMRYVVLYGAKWKIVNAENQYPRVILSIGGVWNENDPESKEDTYGDGTSDDPEGSW